MHWVYLLLIYSFNQYFPSATSRSVLRFGDAVGDIKQISLCPHGPRVWCRRQSHNHANAYTDGPRYCCERYDLGRRVTGQAEIRRREGKGVDCGMAGRKNFRVEETVSLPRPWAGKGPEQGQGSCQAGNERKSGPSEAGRLGQGHGRQPLYILLRIWIFILRAKGCY